MPDVQSSRRKQPLLQLNYNGATHNAVGKEKGICMENKISGLCFKSVPVVVFDRKHILASLNLNC